MAELQKLTSAKSAMNGIRWPIILTDSNLKFEISKYPLLDNYWTVGKRICQQSIIWQVNIDENSLLSLVIQIILTTVILKNGKIINVLVCALPKLQIEKSQMISNCGNDATLTPSSVWIFLIFVAYSRILISSLWTFAIL